MAKIHILGSSSKGNGYVIECGGERLLLECGCRFKDALRACGFTVKSIAGCLVTHRHDDHARYLDEYAAAGIWILAPEDVFKAKGVSGRKIKAVTPGMGYAVGGFKIQPLKAYHDVETVAWVIYHRDLGRLVFATDTCAFPYHIPNVTVWMLEANYSDSILESRLDDGHITLARRNRLMVTHMELGKAIKVLKDNFFTRDRKRHPMVDVILLHLSDDNSNAVQFVARVRREARMNAVVADAGMTVDLGLPDIS